uniref:FLamide receptor 1 n=1 Tax=Platynereis dumerilii TaxID=6359 RepID=A0A0K0PVS0_PLADU|nr:FLamide receptor 1 [Platynereis dumerilii]
MSKLKANSSMYHGQLDAPLTINMSMNDTLLLLDHAPEDDYFAFILYTIVVPILFGFVTLLGTFGNLLVIYVIFSRQKMRTVTNLLLLNLAFADLTFLLICPPFTALSFATMRWPFGNVVCKLMHYLLNVTVYVTIYTLVLISVIRYMTILHNTETIRFRTKRNIMMMCFAIWLLMLVVNIPILVSYGVTYPEDTPETPDCNIYDHDIGRNIFATFFVFAYLLPLFIILVVSVLILQHINRNKPTTFDSKQVKSGDRKKKASRLLILVVVIFALLWLPVHIHLLIAYFGTLPENKFYVAISMLWNTLAYFNSCVNPFIYNYASKEFRDSFREVMCCVRRTNGQCNNTTVTRASPSERNNGEMKRLVTSVTNVRNNTQNASTEL